MSWTNIPSTSLQPGAPVKSLDGLALRDNPIAIANGDAGAPRIQTAALAVDAVFEATARDVSFGALGTYAFLTSTSLTAITAGTSYAGSALKAGGLFNAAFLLAAQIDLTGVTMSGTWLAMGTVAATTPAPASPPNVTTLFVRIA